VESRSVKVIALLAYIFGFTLSFMVAVFLLTPLYILTGDIEGYIGIYSYRIVILGEEWSDAFLDSIRTYILLILPPHLLNIMILGYNSYRVLTGRGIEKIFRVFTLAILLIIVVSIGILTGIHNVILVDLNRYMISFTHSTSAGKILFRGVSITGTPTLMLLTRHVIQILTLAYSLTMIAWHLLLREGAD